MTTTSELERPALTYGVGVSLKAMMDPVAARAHVPTTEP